MVRCGSSCTRDGNVCLPSKERRYCHALPGYARQSSHREVEEGTSPAHRLAQFYSLSIHSSHPFDLEFNLNIKPTQLHDYKTKKFQQWEDLRVEDPTYEAILQGITTLNSGTPVTENHVLLPQLVEQNGSMVTALYEQRLTGLTKLAEVDGPATEDTPSP